MLVGRLTAAFSVHLGCSIADQHQFTAGALLHDLGKLKIRVDLLRKPGPLTPAETVTMREHPVLGYQLLVQEGEHSPVVLSIVRDHHERLDGTGYPRGLQSEEVPEPVRIVMLCDVYAAMTEPRFYAVPMTPQDALRRMVSKQTRLDQRLVTQFAAMIERSLNAAASQKNLWRR